MHRDFLEKLSKDYVNPNQKIRDWISTLMILKTYDVPRTVDGLILFLETCLKINEPTVRTYVGPEEPEQEIKVYF